MKTIEQHFRDTLPHDVCECAIKNTNTKFLSCEFERFESALIGAFSWAQTIEGWDYWKNIYQTYTSKK